MGGLKAFVLTDLHGRLSVSREMAYRAEEEDADLVVLCGDITHFGSVQTAKALLSPFIESRLPLVFVPGNCDPPSLVGVEIGGAECIHGSRRFFGDVVFVGVGGSPYTPFRTPFEMDEETIMNILNRSVEGSLEGYRVVLVSHTPPKDTRLDLTLSGVHCGSSSVRRFIEEKKPSLVLCGHIHEAMGVDRIDGTLLANPGPARDGNYALARIDGELEVELKHL